MDAFYASVEQLDNPSLRGNLSLWVVLKTGAWLQQRVMRPGNLVRKCYEWLYRKENCPDLIFVSPRFDRYKEISSKIQSIFRSIRIWSSRFHWMKLI
jgi:DNA polymerase-4